MATKPTKTKTKNPTIDIPASGENDQLPSAPKSQSEKSSPEIKRASKSATRSATRGISMTPDMRDILNRLRDIEITPDADDPGYDDTENAVTVVTTDNLPRVIERSIAKTGIQNPDWHTVANLPGNMSTAIRTLGRRLFREFTETPTDEIVMIGDLRGMGPNTRAEVNAVAGWLLKSAEKLSDGEIDFSHFMLGYKGKYIMYSVDGVRYMVVVDGIDGQVFGHYIYTWPEDSSLTE